MPHQREFLQNRRELFEIKKCGRRLTIAVRTWRRRRTYIGSIDGVVCAVAPAKGELLRLLLQMVTDCRAA